MIKFEYLSEICGSDKPFTARISLIENTDVEKGTVIYFDTDTLKAAKVKGDGAIAGVCAEKYVAAKDGLVPAYGSGKISVIVSKDAMYRINPYRVTVSAKSTDGSVVTKIADTALQNFSRLVGSKLMLVRKSDVYSDNEASIGTELEIKSVVSDSGYITVNTDYTGSICQGDEFILLPEYGFDAFEIDSKGELSVASQGSGDIFVMDASKLGYVVRFN